MLLVSYIPEVWAIDLSFDPGIGSEDSIDVFRVKVPFIQFTEKGC